MDANDITAGEPESAAKTPARGPLSRMERIAFLVLGSRELSARAALEAMESIERGVHGAEGAAAVAAAARFADSLQQRSAAASSIQVFSDAPGDAAVAAFLEIDPHSKALAIAHLALGLPNLETAAALGISPDSLEVNVLSIAGKLSLGRTATKGCGEAGSHSAAAHAQGIEAQSAPGAAHEASCAACSAMAGAIRSDRLAAGAAIRTLLEPDRDDADIAAAVVMSAAGLSRGSLDPGPMMSKNSCLAAALIIGLVGLGLFWLYTEIYWAGWKGYGPRKETPQAEQPANQPRQQNQAQPLPARKQKKYDLESALADLRSRDKNVAETAHSYMLSTGRASVDRLLTEREKSPTHRRVVDALFVDWARADNRADEEQAQGELGLVDQNARTLAKARASAITRRAEGIAVTIATLDEAIARARAAGKPAREIERMSISRDSAVARKAAADKEAADLASLAAIAGAELRAEIEWRTALSKSRASMISGISAVRIATGRTPAFPPHKAFEAQRAILVPPLSAVPLQPVAALAAISRRVDFPVVIDPAAVRGGAQPVDFPDSAATAEDLVARVAAKTGCVYGITECAVILFKNVESIRRGNLLQQFAASLTAPEPQERAAAAFAFESVTLRRFGFDASAPVDSASNRRSIAAMASWLESNPMIRFDAETGRYVDQKTGIGD